jgi:hypothetical protein
MPLAALGLALFFGAHLLTGTILPLDLIYEHRNYFASFGLLLALVPLLTAPEGQASPQHSAQGPSPGVQTQAAAWRGTLPYARLRHGLLAVLLLSWTMQTALGAYIWGSPSRLTLTLAERAPQSPRAQYALGLGYSIYSQYNPSSPFVPLAYEALERAARLPKSSILPEQALIFLNARMHMPARSAWWDSLLAKLRAHAPTRRPKRTADPFDLRDRPSLRSAHGPHERCISRHPEPPQTGRPDVREVWRLRLERFAGQGSG